MNNSNYYPSSPTSSTIPHLGTTVTKDGTIIHTQSVNQTKIKSPTSVLSNVQSTGKSFGTTVVEAANRSNASKIVQGDEAIGYALDDILTPMERSIKSYLTNIIAEDLIELLSIMSVERPIDPHLWLAQKLLEKGPNAGTYLVVKRADGSPRSKLAIAKDLEEGIVRAHQSEADTTSNKQEFN